MNHCPHCGHELEAQSKFCPYCGKRLVKRSFSSGKPIIVIAVIAIIAAVLTLTLTSLGKPFSQNTRAIARAASSLVLIKVYDVNDIPLATGSGFAAIDDGIIITNYHVIEGDAYRIEAIDEKGNAMDADAIIAYDEEQDIAILRFNQSELRPLATTDGFHLSRGDSVTAIGSPIGFQNMVSTGIFSQYLNLVDVNRTHLLFTASISPGSSGGALFNDKGKVIGITSGSYLEGNDIYYAIPFSYVSALYDAHLPEDELTPAELWAKSEHTYSPTYVRNHGYKLGQQTIVVDGYVSVLMYDVYLVDSPDLMIYDERVYQLEDSLSKAISSALNELEDNNLTLVCVREYGRQFPDFIGGCRVKLRGTVRIYPEDKSKNNLVFVVSEIVSYEEVR